MTTIKDALGLRYAFPEWFLDFEITLENRRLDAVAINLWRKRVYGFEVKVTKQDLMRELADWTKSEAAMRCTDAFYLVTPKGLADGVDLPGDWGWLEQRGKGGLYTRKQPRELPANALMNRELACRMISRVSEKVMRANGAVMNETRQQIRAEIRAELERRDAEQRALERTETDQVRKDYHALLTALGLGPRQWDAQEQALKIAGVLARYKGRHGAMLRNLERLSQDLERHAQLAREAFLNAKDAAAA